MQGSPNSQDRLSQYLVKLNQNIVFDEFKPDYLERINCEDLLSNIPVPIQVENSMEISTKGILLAMLRVIGADNNFPYRSQYMDFVRKLTDGHEEEIILNEAALALNAGDFELACIFARSLLLFNPRFLDGLYIYGLSCKGAYEAQGVSEAYQGSFKAEALQVFEVLTLLHPDFAMGYYYLGYAYLNIGLYLKSKLTFETFIGLVSNNPDSFKAGDNPDEIINEVQSLLLRLEDSVRIEDAINRIKTGDYINSKDILLEYCDGIYKEYWPLWYYLGICSESQGQASEAISHYKKALTLSPSNIQIMQSLVDIYSLLGDNENVKKFSQKIKIVQENISEDELIKNDIKI